MTRARERLILSGAARFACWPASSGGARSAGSGRRSSPTSPRAPLRSADCEVRAASTAVRLTLCAAALAVRSPSQTPQLCRPRAGADGRSRLRRFRAAARASRATATLSYTAIAEYERCAYRYHLQRIVGLPDVAPPGGGGGRTPRRAGSLVHALLERARLRRPRANPTRRRWLRRLPRVGVADAGGDAAPRWPRAFARSPLCARLAAARAVRREEPFAFLGGWRRAAARDVLDARRAEPDGTLLIVDYKTDRGRSEERDLDAHVDRAYSLQRLVYALASLAAGAERVEVAHCFLHLPDRLVSVRFAAADRRELEDELAARIAPLQAAAFPVTAAPGRERCGTCPGRARLCSYEEAVTLGV